MKFVQLQVSASRYDFVCNLIEVANVLQNKIRMMVEAGNTHLIRMGKYLYLADLFDWFGFGRTSKSVVD